MSKAVMAMFGHVGVALVAEGKFAPVLAIRTKQIACHNPTLKPVFATAKPVFVTKRPIVSSTLLDRQCLALRDMAPCMFGEHTD